MINNYKNLTIAKYQELCAVEWEDMEEVDRQVSIIAILNYMTEDEVLRLPLKEYSALAQQTEFLSKSPEVNKRLPNKIRINGKEYEVVKDVKYMSAGQYIDYQQYLAGGDINHMLPYILSCFIIPKGKKYGEYDIDTVIEELRNNMSVEEALNISGFFMKRFRTSIEGMLLYLRWKLKWTKWRTKDETAKQKIQTAMTALQSLQNSIKNGDGFLA